MMNNILIGISIVLNGILLAFLAAIGASLGLAPFLDFVRDAVRLLLRRRGYTATECQRVLVCNLQDDILLSIPFSLVDVAFEILWRVIYQAGHDIAPGKTRLWVPGVPGECPLFIRTPRLREGWTHGLVVLGGPLSLNLAVVGSQEFRQSQFQF